MGAVDEKVGDPVDTVWHLSLLSQAIISSLYPTVAAGNRIMNPPYEEPNTVQAFTCYMCRSHEALKLCHEQRMMKNIINSLLNWSLFNLAYMKSRYAK